MIYVIIILHNITLNMNEFRQDPHRLITLEKYNGTKYIFVETQISPGVLPGGHYSQCSIKVKLCIFSPIFSSPRCRAPPADKIFARSVDILQGGRGEGGGGEERQFSELKFPPHHSANDQHESNEINKVPSLLSRSD